MLKKFHLGDAKMFSKMTVVPCDIAPRRGAKLAETQYDLSRCLPRLCARQIDLILTAVSTLGILIVASSQVHDKSPEHKHIGEVKRLDPAIDALIPPDAKIELLICKLPTILRRRFKIHALP